MEVPILSFNSPIKPVDSHFEQGDILHNSMAQDYRVLEKLSARNLLLMDVKAGKYGSCNRFWNVHQVSKGRRTY